jgi:tetratricopeptide (TPR) repeat protein
MAVGVFAVAPRGVRADETAASAVGATLRLGHIEFPTSGPVAAQPHFIRGVAALHSFWYDEALGAFEAALKIDPQFAMAWWGVAMTHHRPFVPGSNHEAGRRALAQIRRLASLTARERAYIDALRAWYADGNPAERARDYALAMRNLHHAFPNDPEAAAFYALSLLGGSWDDEGALPRHKAAGAIAADVYRRNPNHPGAAHYIIHSYDEPELAKEGLAAAQHYATIAPDSPHALHMPSHIFLQLGMWRETTSSNEAAWSASEAWVQRTQSSPAFRDYHNLHWLIYSCLQEGRYAKAAELVDQFQAMQKDMHPETRFFFHKAAAAYIVDTRRWDRADALFAPELPKVRSAASAPLPPGVEICGREFDRPAATTGVQPADIPAFITTLAAAALGATNSAERLAQLRTSAGGDQAMPEFWRIRVLEIVAVTRAREDNFAAAIAAMREATAIEEALGKPPGPPAAYKPPHELFGEILLRAGEPAEAAAQFERNLRLHPARALSLLGRARALSAMGDQRAARVMYGRLLEIWRQADEDLRELREARDFVALNHG